MAEEDGPCGPLSGCSCCWDATRYSAIYKLAALLALTDVTAERTAPDGTATGTLPAKEAERRVVELIA